MTRIHLALAAAVAASAPAAASTATDTTDATHLMAAYHEAVVSHDAARLSSLFMPSGTAWFSVLSDAGLATVRRTSPGASRLRAGSAEQFVKMVGSSPARLDPRHENVRILTDGSIATVYFDFVFAIDGKIENRGAESWQVVRTDDGWRIVSIIYSSTPSTMLHAAK